MHTKQEHVNGDRHSADSVGVECSIVIPCLNEAETLGECVRRAQAALRDAGIAGEVIVADNGSTDASAAIAAETGARIVPVREPGYGNALMGGIQAALGRYIIMGDADGSYDFAEIPRFVAELRKGFELVQGCRLPSGKGAVLLGAMPWMHRWIGNPLFSLLARQWFGTPVHDIYCGMRGFTKALYERIDQRCTGMEFATEMLIKASLIRAGISEIPIVLHPDGRTLHRPHLRTFRDGWRTLRFFLLYCPRWLFMVPGLILILLGIIAYYLALPSRTIAGINFDAHTLVFGSVFLICGYQSVLFGFLTHVFAMTEGLLPESRIVKRLNESSTMERGFLVGGFAVLFGILLLGGAVRLWAIADFGHLDYSQTMKWVVPGAATVVLGIQTLLASFFASVLGLKRR